MTHQYCTCTPRGIGHNPTIGLSAYAIVHGGNDYPHDTGDFGRCLQVSPNAPTHMRDRSPQWAALVDHWDELKSLYDKPRHEGCFERIRDLLYPDRRPS